MAVRPEDVKGVRFRPCLLGEQYDMGEVDGLLDVLENALADWTRRREALARHNDDIRALDGRTEPPVPVREVRLAVLGPDPLDATTLANHVLQPVRGGSGYDRAEVDHFLEELRSELDRLQGDLEAERRENRRLHDELPPGHGVDYTPVQDAAAAALPKPRSRSFWRRGWPQPRDTSRSS